LCNKYVESKQVNEYIFNKMECGKYKHRFLEVN
jgi:hypothetical protein